MKSKINLVQFDYKENNKTKYNSRCTSIYGTPTMFIDLYNHPNFEKYDMSSLDAGNVLIFYKNLNILCVINVFKEL